MTKKIITETLETYEQKKAFLVADFLQIIKKGNQRTGIGLKKKTSNLFRIRSQQSVAKIDVRSFNKVIHVDTKNLIAEVEGMTTYEDLVNETLRYNLLPTVVPELKSITIGGATTGVGIEASSFRYGLVHETIEEMEILLGDGRTVICRADNEYKDLFFGFPNSYGTLGYALKLKVKLIPTKKFVRLNHTFFDNRADYFQALEELCLKKKDQYHFIDGTVFNDKEFYITTGAFTDEAEKVSDYKYLNIYYQSIRQKKVDYLTALDFIWRWDSDWFWCSRHFGMQNKLMRLFFGTFALNSIFYWKISNWTGRTGFMTRLSQLMGKRYESIIQDVEIPLENCEQFLKFFQQQIDIRPVWICPLKAYDPEKNYDLYSIDPQKLYVNFGFWDMKKTEHEDGYYNRMIEKKVKELKGKKSLYSTAYYGKEEFWELYNKKVYDKLKQKYDPGSRFKDLYEKCVRRN